MAAYFQLIDNATGKPAPFIEVDDRLCAHFGVEPDEEKYYRNWYDTIGFFIALGRDRADIEKTFPSLVDTADFIFTHYTPSAWYAR